LTFATGSIETKFVRLRQAVELGDDIDGWRVCWLGGWDKGRVFYVAMVLRVLARHHRASVDRQSAEESPPVK
jgi:hypothetical protein